MKLEEAEILLALDAGDARAAAGVILRHFSIEADLGRYTISHKGNAGQLPCLRPPLIAIYFIEGGFAIWSPDEGFIRDETSYRYMFSGHIRMENSYDDIGS